jgi:hypothetical protein
LRLLVGCGLAFAHAFEQGVGVDLVLFIVLHIAGLLVLEENPVADALGGEDAEFNVGGRIAKDLLQLAGAVALGEAVAPGDEDLRLVPELAGAFAGPAEGFDLGEDLFHLRLLLLLGGLGRSTSGSGLLGGGGGKNCQTGQQHDG